MNTFDDILLTLLRKYQEQGNVYAKDPVVQLADAMWRYHDETWLLVDAEYLTELEARLACQLYSIGLGHSTRNEPTPTSTELDADGNPYFGFRHDDECPECLGRGGTGGADFLSDPFIECLPCGGTGKKRT